MHHGGNRKAAATKADPGADLEIGHYKGIKNCYVSVDQKHATDYLGAVPDRESAGERATVSFDDSRLFRRGSKAALHAHCDQWLLPTDRVIPDGHAYPVVFRDLHPGGAGGRRAGAGFNRLGHAEAEIE